MKSNEYPSPVDEYFRQHEGEIPVTYDPEHWDRLATALDNAQPAAPDTPALRKPSRPRRFRGGKGWWVSGIWLLAISTAIWLVWQQANSSIPRPDLIQSETITGPVQQAPKSPAPTSADSRQTAVTDAGNPPAASPAPALPTPETAAPETTPTAVLQPTDSTAIHPAPEVRKDSLRTEQKPVRKKKNLFW